MSDVVDLLEAFEASLTWHVRNPREKRPNIEAI
jgi:hypothetical protein